MQDMLVRLYDLPDIRTLEDKMNSEAIVVREALAAEKSIVVDWVQERFGSGWQSR